MALNFSGNCPWSEVSLIHLSKIARILFSVCWYFREPARLCISNGSLRMS
jgi:hypothetical protein